MRNTNEGGPNPQKNILKSVCFCVSLLLNFNLKDTLSLSKHGTRDPEVSISLQINGLPLIATEHLLWLRPSPHVAKLASGVPVPVAPISCLEDQRSHLGLRDQQLKFQHFYSSTKSPTWEANTLHSFLTLPSLLANKCSCLPQAHCQFLSTVWVKGLHCTQREGQGQCSPARPQPVVGEAEGSQRQAQEAAAVQGVHLPIRDTTGLPTNQQVLPQKHTPKRHTTNSNRLFMNNYHCTRLDDISRLESVQCITAWGKGGTPKTSKEEKTKCTQTFQTQTSRFYRLNHQDLWLSVWLHKRTRCCHPQRKCYRQLKSICAANHGDQRHRHQLLDYLHPNVPTCAAVWRLQCIWQYAAYFSKNDLTIGHALLKTQNWIGALHEHSIYIYIIYNLSKS